MKPIIIFMCIIVSIASCRETEPSPDQYSVTLEADYGTAYRLNIQLPAGHDMNKAGGYPAIIYTDADYLRKHIVKAVKQINPDQNSIMIGISYENENLRETDFTPTTTGKAGTGQAARFVAFLESTLLPHLIRNYAVSEQQEDRTYCGHSLGGLLGTYLLFTEPHLFGNYLLISPALMWDGQAIFRLESQNRPALQQLNARVFLTAGTQETGGFHTTRQHLAGLLSDYYPNVQVQTATYRNADHSGVIAPSLADGLKLIWQL